MADFIPRRDGDLVTWLKNVSAKLDLYSKSLEMTDAQVKIEQKRCDNIITAIQLNEKKRAEYQATVTQTDAIKEHELSALRALVRRIKASTIYTDAVGKDFGVVGTSEHLSQVQNRPEFKTEVHSGFVRVKFVKGNLDGVNIYRRMQGETNWTFLARDTHSPYDDHTPVKQTGTAETREYSVHGVIKDEEVGERSAILSLVVPG